MPTSIVIRFHLTNHVITIFKLLVGDNFDDGASYILSRVMLVNTNHNFLLMGRTIWNDTDKTDQIIGQPNSHAAAGTLIFTFQLPFGHRI